ncbi:MAG: 4-(cytidine 5'-diphospho)-2-C-methyl-D-erythritol kinase [Thermoleophilia bacterium]|nr:4-(cytidine 5'-diphospho)-2-C-methyl-D-erythritol kinase [Thermoleophilia bacterium]
MAGLSLEAPAKLNLCLRVGPVREDGYHPLASLMVALDGLADTVTVRRADRRAVACPGIDGPANLAWRALDALDAEAGEPLPPLAVDIAKGIPAEAGLGGGSSDAAAVLVAARDLLGLPLDAAALERAAARVGSDVPFLVRGGAQWATGRGDRLVPMPAPEGLWAVVVPPVTGLSTPRVYRAFDRLARPAALPDGPPGGHWTAGWAVNDLWPAALACAPALGGVARRLWGFRPRTVLLCGSGGAMAALFGDGDAAAAAAAAWGPAAALCRPAPPRAI